MKFSFSKINLFTLLSFVLIGSGNLFAKPMNWPKVYSENLFHITEVMVTDVASPPVAARIYAYSNLAAYLVIKSQGGSFLNQDILANTYLENHEWNIPESNVTSPEFVSILAMLKVGQAIMPSGYLLEKRQEEWIEIALKNKVISKKNLTEHKELANLVADKVMEIAKKDGYLQLSTLTRYTPQKGEGFWYPTPPAYIAAVEPEWETIQPFFIKDLEDFEPAPMAPFDMAEGSSFHNQLMDVYNNTNELNEERKLIANFRDFNSFKI